ncbi:MAG TPA: transmembrane 220 family protein [Bacteroidota bacterium]|jgi:hypothetical protein
MDSTGYSRTSPLRIYVKEDSPMSAAFRRANFAMSLLFLFASALQINSPNPLQWITMYLLASITCFLAFRGTLTWPVPASVGLVALVWAATIYPFLAGRRMSSNILNTFHLTSPEVEKVREVVGLVLVLSWMTYLTVRILRKKQ